ncbi:MAG: AMP-binding protein [Sandaracinaceae bacterium]|nr:AMP-binding protein [Sandaracinaceae bacterium]
MRERPGVRTVVHDTDDGLGIDGARPERGRRRSRQARRRAVRADRARARPPARHRLHLGLDGRARRVRQDRRPARRRGARPRRHLRARGRLARAGDGAPYHIYGLLFGVLVPLSCGGALYRHTPLYAEEVAAVLATGADVLVTVPAHLRALTLAPAAERPAARVFSSGAPLSPEVAAEAKRRFGWTVTEVFGSSETGGIGWRESGGEGPWTPLPGVEVSATERDEIVVRSPFLSPRSSGPFVGADRVRVESDGRFVHLGRADGVLKIGGVRVSIAEVERRLLAAEGVRDAAVLAVEVGGARGYEVWVAVVAPGLDAAAVRAALREWLAPVAMPRRVRMVDALPREPSGKLPRAALEGLFSPRRGS